MFVVCAPYQCAPAMRAAVHHAAVRALQGTASDPHLCSEGKAPHRRFDLDVDRDRPGLNCEWMRAFVSAQVS